MVQTKLVSVKDLANALPRVILADSIQKTLIFCNLECHFIHCRSSHLRHQIIKPSNTRCTNLSFTRLLWRSHSKQSNTSVTLSTEHIKKRKNHSWSMCTPSIHSNFICDLPRSPDPIPSLSSILIPHPPPSILIDHQRPPLETQDCVLKTKTSWRLQTHLKSKRKLLSVHFLCFGFALFEC